MQHSKLEQLCMPFSGLKVRMYVRAVWRLSGTVWKPVWMSNTTKVQTHFFIAIFCRMLSVTSLYRGCLKHCLRLETQNQNWDWRNVMCEHILLKMY